MTKDDVDSKGNNSKGITFPPLLSLRTIINLPLQGGTGVAEVLNSSSTIR